MIIKKITIFLIAILSCLVTLVATAADLNVVDPGVKVYSEAEFHKLYETALLHGVYVGLGIGYSKNLAAGTTNDITLHSPADIQTLQQQNADPSGGPLGRIEAGYIWPLSRHWSWSLGGRLDYYANFKQSGQAKFVVNPDGGYGYQYTIGAKALDAVGRLIFSTKHFEYYGELMVGAAFLSSSDYVAAVSGPRIPTDQSEIGPSYGLGGGAMFRITSKTSIGVSVDYNDLGSARLGPPPPYYSSVAMGSIEQPLRMLTVMLNLQRVF